MSDAGNMIEQRTGRRRRKRGQLYLIAERIDVFVEKHPLARLLKIVFTLIGGIILIGTGLQIFLDYQGRQEDRLARAWETVVRPVGGNTGKGVAMNLLIQEGHRLSGVDLSCERMGGRFRGEPVPMSNVCVGGVEIEELNPPEGFETDGWNLSGARIVQSTLRNVTLANIVAEHAVFWGVDASGTELSGCMSRASFYYAILNGTKLQQICPDEPAIAEPFIISTTDVSGLRTAIFGTATVSGNNFAWADRPPAEFLGNGPSVHMTGVTYCDPAKRKAAGDSVFGTFGINNVFQNCTLDADAARTAFPKEWAGALKDDLWVEPASVIESDLGSRHR